MEMHVQLMISADCHASALPDTYRQYLDPGYDDAYDQWLGDTEMKNKRKAEHTGAAIYSDQALEEFGEIEEVAAGGVDGGWDSTRRLRELEADGTVAEVLYPGAGGPTVTPFDVGLMTYQYEQDPALWLAGCRAYNRWLGDFCNDALGRRAGVGLITVDDIDTTVGEIQQMRDLGLFGGVLLCSGTGDNPLYNHPRYDPVWTACADEGLPVHTHSGWTPNYGDFTGSLGIFLTEISWYAHRPFWLLMWSGAFERHPGLRMVMNEQGSTWAPATLDELDHFYELRMFDQLRRDLPLKPSEYFRRQVYLGAGFTDADEVDVVDRLGADHLMWGSDYPHIEGTWPNSQEMLNQQFAERSADEIARLVGGNAADLYGFDKDALTNLSASLA
ncbi:MAG: amidohydrolase [Acidimicrobiia bacterium]|nr:amidohydrolase [Acidimicrobiia bacterium]MYL08653.1 amidohydrolase [Acidimicrobiia bacterium]